MTITKIRTRTFKTLCEEARDNYERSIENGFELSYRNELADVLLCAGDFWRESDEWQASHAAAPATFDELFSMLKQAAAARMQFGASDDQCRTIARRWANEGNTLASCRLSVLSAREAAAIIG